MTPVLRNPLAQPASNHLHAIRRPKPWAKMSRIGVGPGLRNGCEARSDPAGTDFIPAETGPNPCSAAAFGCSPMARGRLPFGPLQAGTALLYAAPRERLFRLFLGSSAVEHSTVNRMVAGSNPARGASKINYLLRNLTMKCSLNFQVFTRHARTLM